MVPNLLVDGGLSTPHAYRYAARYSEYQRSVRGGCLHTAGATGSISPGIEFSWTRFWAKVKARGVSDAKKERSN
jgi:hypothetical protein